MRDASESLRALSRAESAAATEGRVPEPERIGGARAAGELWSVPVPMPGGHLAYTLSTVHVGASGAVAVVDPGWGTEEGIERLGAVLGGLGRSIEDIETIVVTHAHPDHVGAADALRRASGARLLMHEREQAALDRAGAANATGGRTGVDREDTGAEPFAGWGAPDPVIDRLREQREAARAAFAPPAPADALLRDGDSLPIPGLDWEVLWTPGHTAGHICLVDRVARRILTGDHVLPTVFPGIGIGPEAGAGPVGGSPVAGYLASLRRLAPYDDFEVLPGHGYRFRGLAARRREMEEHVLRRAGEVATAAAADPGATVWEIAAQLTWTGGWERLSAGPMLYSALLQVGYYLDFVRAGGSGRIGDVGDPASDPSSGSSRAARS